LINASGTRIAFSVFEKDKRMVYVVAPGEPQQWLRSLRAFVDVLTKAAQRQKRLLARSKRSR
jgi:hypothetical protein